MSALMNWQGKAWNRSNPTDKSQIGRIGETHALPLFCAPLRAVPMVKKPFMQFERDC